MFKPITPAAHGVIDYVTSATGAAAPARLDFPPQARTLFRSLAGGYTALSAITDYPASVSRVVPFKGHGAAELAVGAVLPALPYLLGFSHNKAARNACFALAGITMVVAALTDWSKEGGEHGERRHQLD